VIVPADAGGRVIGGFTVEEMIRSEDPDQRLETAEVVFHDIKCFRVSMFQCVVLEPRSGYGIVERMIHRDHLPRSGYAIHSFPVYFSLYKMFQSFRVSVFQNSIVNCQLIDVFMYILSVR
jgi:hypothetical protein